MTRLIDTGSSDLQRISGILRETPLVVLRQMLPDREILLAWTHPKGAEPRRPAPGSSPPGGPRSRWCSSRS